jgi:hypothetical protein
VIHRALSLKERKPPSHDDLVPWAVVQPGNTISDGIAVMNVGVFEKWQPGCRSYVVPWSGAYFDAEIKK